MIHKMEWREYFFLDKVYKTTIIYRGFYNIDELNVDGEIVKNHEWRKLLTSIRYSIETETWRPTVSIYDGHIISEEENQILQG